MFPSFFNIEPGHIKEQQWETLGETSISSFFDSWWLLYTQSLMSEGKHSSYGDKGAFKKESRLSKWAAVKDTALKAHFSEHNIAENYPRSYPPN